LYELTRPGGSLKRSLGMVSGACTIPIPIDDIGMRLPPIAGRRHCCGGKVDPTCAFVIMAKSTYWLVIRKAG
jgi:hypothetical protein